MDASEILQPEDIPSFEELLSDLSDREVDQHVNFLDREQFVPGETIFYQDEPSTSLFIIQNGTVEISKMSSEEGSEYTPLVQLGEGNIFGEISFLTKSDRSASAVASTPVVLYCISRKNFEQIIDEHPSLGCRIYDALVQVLCYRLQRTDSKLIDLADRFDYLNETASTE
jgi:CRP-like cAMP-binding protein